MDGQISLFDLREFTEYQNLRSVPDMNPPTLSNKSGSVKLRFDRAEGRVDVEMQYKDTLMICCVDLDDLKEIVKRL